MYRKTGQIGFYNKVSKTVSEALAVKQKLCSIWYCGLPRWLNTKESTCNEGYTGDTSVIPGSGRSPGGRNGKLLLYSYLKNPMDRGGWRATVHGVTKSQTQLKQLSMHTRPLKGFVM